VRGSLIGAVCAATACATPGVVPPEAAGDADDLLIVDCLLPGQVRKLGQSLTYMTPKRPVKTSAVDCEIRGGEYVAFDRASYADALRIWLPRAKEGDPEAQTYVGEIFEKGLGVPADYAAAAEWYHRAAEQGHGPAQINLGQLYELGRGVERDPDQALVWYRRAAGIGDLDAEFVSFVGDAERFADMQETLAAKDRKVRDLSHEVAELNRELGAAEEARFDASGAVETARVELDAERAALAEETARLEEQRRRLAAEAERLQAERAGAEVAAADRAALRELEQTLGEQRRVLDSYAVAVREREAEVARRARELEEKTRALAELEARTEALEEQAEARLDQYAQVVEPVAPAAIPGPSIHIVEPEILLTRSAAAPDLYVRAKDQTLVGRVDAPAGLLSLVLNEIELEVDPDGFFESRLRVRPTGTPVRLVAIDKQGKRTTRALTLRRGEGGGAPRRAEPVVLRPADTGVDFGRYHALVIGVSAYRHMPVLETADDDARAIAATLGDRYGFEVQTLIDPDRYAILSALDGLRRKLRADDNLLVYYAGHGEFDEASERGYWLPVEAEPENRANWISNQSVTDILNAMAAQHVLVVADSCYSGALTESALPLGASGEAGAAWQSLLAEKRSRTALTSGGLAPVLDGGGGAHSIFANAFLEILQSNDDVLGGRNLYESLAARVTYRARTRSFRQEPEYAPIRFGGHEAGDFYFVPGG
jgi:uncharacterized caspase-like protein